MSQIFSDDEIARLAEKAEKGRDKYDLKLLNFKETRVIPLEGDRRHQESNLRSIVHYWKTRAPEKRVLILEFHQRGCDRCVDCLQHRECQRLKGPCFTLTRIK
jgi:hypothetical protein